MEFKVLFSTPLLRRKKLTKLLLIMKLSAILIFIGCLQVSARTYSQHVTLSSENVPLQVVFREIEKQTGFHFFYRVSLASKFGNVNVHLYNVPVDEAMNRVLYGLPLKYKIVNKTIVVTENPAPEPPVYESKPLLPYLNVSGTVTDPQQKPLAGASIKIKNTERGVLTDEKGAFSLNNVDAQAILVVSYVGFQNIEIPVSGRSVIRIVMQPAETGLADVVVVGYGTQKKVNLTGAVSTVDLSKVAETRPVTNLSSALAGMAPGLYVRSGNNDPGNNASLLVRGQGTLNNPAPLIIIDGVEGDISRISPLDIASVSVLKDASSAAIYGSRAANGVILITTKQGSKGKISFSYDGYVAAQSVGRLIPLVDNSVEYMQLVNEAAKNSNVAPVFSEANIQLWKDNEGGDPLLWPNTNWADGLFRNVSTANHNISVSGGSDKLTTYMSFNYAGNPGMIENTGYDRYSFRSNSQLQATKWLRVGMNLNGTHTDKDRGSVNLNSMFAFSILAVPTVVPRAPDGRYGGTNNSEENAIALSPIFYVNMFKGSNKTNTLSSRFYTNINPIDGLNLNISYNYNYLSNKVNTIPTQNDRWNFQTNTILVSGKTDVYIQKTDVTSLRNFMDADISYEKTLLDRLYLKLMVGGSQENYVSENLTITRTGLIDESLTQLNAATKDPIASGALSDDWAMQSYFGRLNLSWDTKYLAELNFRRDGSSRFTATNRWGNFPSASVGWRISEEPFMRSLKASRINDLKIRASYGALGNNAVGDYETIPALSLIRYVFGGAPVDGFYQARIANTNLKWESTYVTNIGLDFSLAARRLSGSLDFYNKLTKNILINLPAPAVNGTVGIPPMNSAQVQNRGVEVALNWKDQIGNIEYAAGTNFTYNRNKVVKFKGNEYSLSGTSMIKEGLPINTQYLWIVDRIVQTEKDVQLVQDMIADAPVGVNPFPFGKPELGDFLYRDLNNDGIVNDEDRMNVGHGSNPQFFYSFTLGANYKGFDVSAFFDGVGGIKTYFQNDYYDPSLTWSNIINREIADGRWYEGRTTPAAYPRVLLNDAKNLRQSDFWLSDMSYLKIRNIQIGYTVSSALLAKLHISKLRVYATLENYFTFTRYKGLDPEVDGIGYPNVRQAVFGLNVSL